MPLFGHIVTQETREKLRKSNLGKRLSDETKRKISLSSKGNKHALGNKLSADTRLKMSLAKKGIKFSESHRRAFLGNKHLLGHKHSEESKRKMGISRLGDKNGNWKGGITPINRSIRTSKQYKLWREEVFKRDNWTCVNCGARSCIGRKVIIHADHIKPFAYFPELRFCVSNGRTLCEPCHKDTDTYAGNIKRIKLCV